MVRQATAWLLAALAFTAGERLSAQERAGLRSGVQPHHGADLDSASIGPANRAPSRDPLKVTAASAVVPGAGQLLLRQRRAAAYLALEAAGIAMYVTQTRDGRRQRLRYREIARAEARATLSPNGPDGNWDYYERMEKFVASGDFDRIPGGDLDPELDEETWNGSVWLLARQTYWRDPAVPPATSSPEHEAAVRFYRERAVGTDMRWSWAGKVEAFGRFRAAIDGSNSAFRSAGHTASLVLANHFLSAVDAYVSVRTRIRREADGSTTITASLPIRY